ncbi:MAG: hypothetical protein IJ722_03920 [Alloprevotella sp.]|nr:hypothetical protein [Alloprevotella sp.]
MILEKKAYVPLRAKLISYESDGVLFTASSLDRDGNRRNDKYDSLEIQGSSTNYDLIKANCGSFGCNGFSIAEAEALYPDGGYLPGFCGIDSSCYSDCQTNGCYMFCSGYSRPQQYEAEARWWEHLARFDDKANLNRFFGGTDFQHTATGYSC